jgi:hypothetical protein
LKKKSIIPKPKVELKKNIFQVSKCGKCKNEGHSRRNCPINRSNTHELLICDKDKWGKFQLSDKTWISEKEAKEKYPASYKACLKNNY